MRREPARRSTAQSGMFPQGVDCSWKRTTVCFYHSKDPEVKSVRDSRGILADRSGSPRQTRLGVIFIFLRGIWHRLVPAAIVWSPFPLPDGKIRSTGARSRARDFPERFNIDSPSASSP